MESMRALRALQDVLAPLRLAQDERRVVPLDLHAQRLLRVVDEGRDRGARPARPRPAGPPPRARPGARPAGARGRARPSSATAMASAKSRRDGDHGQRLPARPASSRAATVAAADRPRTSAARRPRDRRAGTAEGQHGRPGPGPRRHHGQQREVDGEVGERPRQEGQHREVQRAVHHRVRDQAQRAPRGWGRRAGSRRRMRTRDGPPRGRRWTPSKATSGEGQERDGGEEEVDGADEQRAEQGGGIGVGGDELGREQREGGRDVDEQEAAGGGGRPPSARRAIPARGGLRPPTRSSRAAATRERARR